MTESMRIVLASRPAGPPIPENFRTETVDTPALQPGHVLVRTLFLSLDPYMRGLMSTAESYAPPLEIGQVMAGATVVDVLESRDPLLEAGDIVLAFTGWQTHAVVPAQNVRKLEPTTLPLSTALGVLGMPGFAAYAGLLEIGKPSPGETVAVAAATGPVGSAVGQIAKIKGARSIGIAGGARKVAYLREIGFDAALDHRAPDFADQLAAAVPDGIDVYFENVGGAVAQAVFPLLNKYARVPICGMIADYNATGSPPGPDRLPAFYHRILIKSVTVRGFLQDEFAPTLYPDFLREMGEWVAEGRVRYLEDVVTGLDAAPEAFIGLLEGRNFGKLVVKVAE
ncbi:NADP-dependent oxidoreductase [Nocardia sp. CNY236]|uniref:NADP-dependent oxidoreductase n=1 Tax=Nocardia sp. CNY236 TaxID=1169152 RepID=UPI00040D260B|nr:NADP-dependent oxidoreductase [Nocardia sp. CNY236]